MNWIGGNDIEFVRGGEDVMPRIVVDHLRASVMQHMVILLAEKLIGGGRNQVFQFTDDDAPNLRIGNKGSGRDSSAPPGRSGGGSPKSDRRRFA